MEHTKSTDSPEVVIVVALDRDSHAATFQRIEEDFQRELQFGLIHVISPTTAFFKEACAERLGWGNVSFTDGFKNKTAYFNKRLSFLFEYCFRISKNFLLLTDQARTNKRYFPVIKQRVDNFEKQPLSSYSFNFGANAFPGLGRLYSRKLTGDMAEFGAMFSDGQLPSQMIDMYGFMRDSVKTPEQSSEEVLFDMEKELHGITPEVEFEINGDFHEGHGLEKAFYEKKGFAWLRSPKADNNLVMVFKEALRISRVRIGTGSPLYRDTLHDSELIACKSNAGTDSCDESQCVQIGDFRDPVLNAVMLENVVSFPVKCLKIVVKADAKHWVIFREISVWLKE